jgi:serine/arginine repetitive matrix protein 2
MEEDDDNFLDGVIEFGDGRQYKIESNEQAGVSASQSGAGQRPQTGDSATPSGPVSKEERFVDDFDRSWPKSRTSPATAPRDFPSPVPQPASLSVSPVISQATHSSQDSSRVLFNERSNRLEPYSQTHRPGQGAFGAKRPGYQEGSSPVESRQPPHNIQVLQKAAPGDSRSRRFSSSNNAGPTNGFAGDRNHQGRRDAPPPSPRLTRDLPPHTADKDWDFDRGRRTTMGPPPIPSHAIKQDGGRQLPPHLSQISPNTPARRLPSRDSRFSPSEPSTGLPPSSSARFPPQSPAVSHASLSLVSPAAATSVPLPLSAPELDEVRKDVMHTAAERAKQRRQQEEAEREAQKERARRKAAEIEEKIKATEAEKQKAKESEEATKLEKVVLELFVRFGAKLIELSRRRKLFLSSKPLLKLLN